MGSITSIGSSAFENCTQLANINFPNTLTSVGTNAFKNTAWFNNQSNGVVYVNTVAYAIKGDASSTITLDSNTTKISKSFLSGHNEVTTLVLNEGLEIIETDALTNSHLQAFHLPSTVNSYGSNRCFQYANTVTVASGNTKYDSRDNCNAIIETSTNTLLSGCPSTVIPNTVTKIGDRAFTVCPFTAITIPNSVTSIGGNAFYGCRGLTTVTIPEGVTSIGGSAFEECANLLSLTIPNSVTSIGGLAFRHCFKLKALHFPSGATIIPYGCCSDDYELEDVVIPEGYTTIKTYAFIVCRSLQTITLPSTVTTIETQSMSSCTSLTELTVLAITPPKIKDKTFAEDDNLNSIYVPPSSVSAYKTASGWSTYADIIQAIPTA